MSYTYVHTDDRSRTDKARATTTIRSVPFAFMLMRAPLRLSALAYVHFCLIISLSLSSPQGHKVYLLSVYSVLSLYCMVDISHMHGTVIVVPYGTVVLALSSSLRWWYTMCTALGSANKDMLVWSMTRYLG
jgi:hypothetical protein